MRKSLFIILIFITVSWSLGLYALTKFYTPILVIPLLNKFYWVPTYQALLGLTTILTIATLLIFFVIKRYRKNIKKWYLLNSAGYLIWTITILSQLKIAAYNLGICH